MTSKVGISYGFLGLTITGVVFLFALLLAAPRHAQENPGNLLLKLDQMSSGPGGGRSFLCLRVYSNGKILESEWSRAGVEVVDQTGKTTTSAKTNSFEYRVDQRDVLWRIGELEEFLKSKPVLHLASSFAPPHRPVDFAESLWSASNSLMRERKLST
jgi:hypothetical protein